MCCGIKDNMKKQIYVTPEVTVVHMTSCEHLLAGSANMTEWGDDDCGVNVNGNSSPGIHPIWKD